MKLNNQFTINLDEETAELVNKLAKIYQRKPAELLRLLVVPQLSNEWAKIQAIEHPENRQPFNIAHCRY